MAAALLCGLLTSCGNSEKKQVTLNIKTPAFQFETVVDSDTADAYTFLKNAAEDFAAQYTDADVTINVSQYETTRQQEEIDNCFGTDKAVDVLWGNLTDYIFEGWAVPLDDLVTDELRADIDETYWEECEFGGRVYIMPFFASQMVLCYNRDLFRQAGLESYFTDEAEIQSWTLEEWDDILGTLRAELPSTVYPMMMYAATSTGDMHIMTLLRSRGSTFYDGEGNVDLETPEGIAALQWIRDGVDKGYFPSHSENLVIMDCYDLFQNDQLAIYCANIAHQTLFDGTGKDYGLVNLPSADGRGFNTTTVLGFQVFDNGDEEKIQVARDFVKFIYETDWLDYSADGIPVSARVASKYADRLDYANLYLDNQGLNNNYDNGNANWDGVREVFHLHIQDLLYGEKSVEQIARELDDDCNAALEEGRRSARLHE